MKLNIKKLTMTLVALFAMTAGAWAETETISTASELWQGAKTFTGTNVTVSVENGGNENGSYVSSIYTMNISVTGDNIITGLVLTIGYNPTKAGYMLALPGNCTASGSGSHSTFVTVTDIDASSVTMKMDEYAVYVEKVEVTYANPDAPMPVAGQTNQWQFTMPAADVELQVEYYAQAMFATEGNEALTPTAAEGVIAGTEDPIVIAGQTEQGTVMYAVTSTNQATAPELSAFSSEVPTAKDYADDGAAVYVWYYIQGADAEPGTIPTADNTFSDSEVCATPLAVNILSNKFDITFVPENANTIEDGKATVTVNGTAATLTEGKLTDVKMGSEVKLTAKQGYKFKKVEATKKQ